MTLPFEKNLRKYLLESREPLNVAKLSIEEEGWEDSDLYRQTIESLNLNQLLVEELGYLEDKSPTRMKQLNLNFKKESK